MRTQDTDVGPILLRDDETLLGVAATPVVRPPHLPDPELAMVRLTRVASPRAIGTRPAFAAGAPEDGVERHSAFGLFEALFGRDALVIARFAGGRWPGLPVATFEALAALQGLAVEDAPEVHLYARRLERPGRIPHETRDPETDPIAAHLASKAGWAFPYYHSDDSTPLFVRDLACYANLHPDVLDRTVIGRDGAERSLLDALAAGLDHVRASLVEGLLVSRRPDPGPDGALPAYGVWQDSPDAYFRTDGTLPEGPIAALEVQAHVFDALDACADLVGSRPDLAGMLGESEALRANAGAVRAAVLSNFWDTSTSSFVPAVEQRDATWQRLAGRKSAMGWLLDSGILEERRYGSLRDAIVEALFDPAFGIVTPWGLRTLGIVDARDRYRPDAYHNGLIWLFDNHVIATGLRRHGWHGLASWLDQQIVTACERLHLFPEHVRGDSTVEAAVTEHTVDVMAADPRLGTYRTRVAQPPQLVQGWTLAAYIDAQRCLKTLPGASGVLTQRNKEARLLDAIRGVARGPEAGPGFEPR
jgi:glycogen debranching enzyme